MIRRALGRWLRVAVLILVSWSWLRGSRHALIVRAELEHADALVILSGSSAYVERTQSAAQLWREEPRHLCFGPTILCSADGLKLSGAISFTVRATEELKRAGVAGDSIEVLPQRVRAL